MNGEMKHTPTPWQFSGPNGMDIFDTHKCATVCTVEYRDRYDQAGLANAAFIVEACNNYERVVALNAELVKTVESLLRWCEKDPDGIGERIERGNDYDRARALLAKAKEQQP